MQFAFAVVALTVCASCILDIAFETAVVRVCVSIAVCVCHVNSLMHDTIRSRHHPDKAHQEGDSHNQYLVSFVKLLTLRVSLTHNEATKFLTIYRKQQARQLRRHACHYCISGKRYIAAQNMYTLVTNSVVKDPPACTHCVNELKGPLQECHRLAGPAAAHMAFVP